MKFFAGAFSALLLIVAAPSIAAAADVVFQSVSNLSGQPASNALCSSCNGRFQIFNGFELADDAYITGVKVTVYSPGSTYYPFTGGFDVLIYDGGADMHGAPLIYSASVRPTGSASGSQLPYTSAHGDNDTAVVSFALPSVLLEKNHGYTISFLGNSLGLAVFKNGSSPMYGEEGPGYSNVRYVPYFSDNNNQSYLGSVGFQLSGDITVIDHTSPGPEPATWAMMLIGFGVVGGVFRSSRMRAVSV